MSTIAFDGKSLAGDKMTSFGTLTGTTTKVHRIGQLLVAGAGTAAEIVQMREWLRAGAEPNDFPPSQRDLKDCSSILAIRPDGSIALYENTPYPILLENRFWAIGSGRDYAMAAMYLGKSAKEAVELAAVFDPSTGNGVDVLEL